MKELQDRIAALEAEVARLKAALEEVVGASRTKGSMKDIARKALYGRKE